MASKAIHFVGFAPHTIGRAAQVFGAPDFIHPDARNLHRAFMAPGDTVVFARGAEQRVDPDVMKMMEG